MKKVLKNSIKIEGILVSEDNSENIIENFKKFCEERSILFSGMIGDKYVERKKSRNRICVEDLQMSSRLRNILRREDIYCLDDLEIYYIEEIQEFRNLGPATFLELKNLMNKYNVQPRVYIKEVKDFSYWSRKDQKIMYEKNVRTLEKLYSMSELDIYRLFGKNKRLCNKLLEKRDMHAKNKKELM